MSSDFLGPSAKAHYFKAIFEVCYTFNSIQACMMLKNIELYLEFQEWDPANTAEICLVAALKIPR